MANPKHKLMPKWFRLFFPRRFVAITISKNLIWYRTQDQLENYRLIAHESCHANQYEEYGWFGFVTRYLWFTCRYGYWDNPLEVAARDAEGSQNAQTKIS